MNTAKLEALKTKLSTARARVAKLEEEFETVRLAELRRVDYTKNDNSYTLRFNGRKINAEFGVWGRLKVTENRKVIVSEFDGGIHDLRFAIALGNV